MSPHASLSLPFERVSLSLSFPISSHPLVCLSCFMLHYSPGIFKTKEILGLLPCLAHLCILSSSVQTENE